MKKLTLDVYVEKTGLIGSIWVNDKNQIEVESIVSGISREGFGDFEEAINFLVYETNV